MSNRDRWLEVCRPESALVFSAATLCAPSNPATASPIDKYLEATRSLVVLAGNNLGPTAPPAVVPHQLGIGRLLILGLVAEAERYFRGLLGELAGFCPVCIEFVGGESIALSSILNHGIERLGQGLFEEVSFASREGVEAQTRRITGMQIKSGSAVGKCLHDFSALCHVRHASVHAAGELGIRNRLAIGLHTGTRFSVRVDFAGFSSAAQTCHNLIRAYNIAVYKHLVERWIAKRILRGNWASDRLLFGRLYLLFYSKSDSIGPARPYGAYSSLKGVLRKAHEKLA